MSVMPRPLERRARRQSVGGDTPLARLVVSRMTRACSRKIAIGRQAQQDVRRQLPQLRDDVVARYLTSLGRRLAAREITRLH